MTWRKVPGLVCRHCGRAMESDIGQNHTGIVIVGLEPMIFRHADDHTSECAITMRHKAEPYSVWGQQDAWKKADLCGEPCPANMPCDLCTPYWDRMRREGFWIDGRGWTEKGQQSWTR